MIIDTHVHIWNRERSDYEWLKEVPDQLNRDYSLVDLEPDRSITSVKAGVLVQADNSWADTELMLESAKVTDWIKGVVGWLPLMNTKKAQQFLERVLAKEPYYKGVRHLIHNEADDEWLLQSSVIDSLKLLVRLQLPFDLVGVKVSHIKTALKLAEKIPDLRMVFDHLNQPPIQSGEHFGAWGTWMKAAAQNPNFYVKISGLSATAGKELFTVEKVKPYVNFVLEAFGENRCFLGGDWPVALLSASYNELWKVYTQVIDELVGDQDLQCLIKSENAKAFYSLEV